MGNSQPGCDVWLPRKPRCIRGAVTSKSCTPLLTFDTPPVAWGVIQGVVLIKILYCILRIVIQIFPIQSNKHQLKNFVMRDSYILPIVIKIQETFTRKALTRESLGGTPYTAINQSVNQ